MSVKMLRLLIHDSVQGVLFRDSMRSEAQRLGISVWVRHRSMHRSSSRHRAG